MIIKYCSKLHLQLPLYIYISLYKTGEIRILWLTSVCSSINITVIPLMSALLTLALVLFKDVCARHSPFSWYINSGNCTSENSAPFWNGWEWRSNPGVKFVQDITVLCLFPNTSQHYSWSSCWSVGCWELGKGQIEIIAFPLSSIGFSLAFCGTGFHCVH